MDTAIMAVRAALLILVTCTFAVAWSGDCPDRTASVSRPVKVNADRENDSVRPQSRSPSMIPLKQNSPDFTGADIPLPTGIAPGTYLIVDQFGSTITRTITIHETFSDGQVSAGANCDHFAVKLNAASWHYIRINHPTYDLAFGQQPDRSDVKLESQLQPPINSRITAQPSGELVR